MSARAKVAARVVGVGLLLLATGASLLWLYTQVGVVEKRDHNAYFLAQGIAWAAFLSAVFLARKLPRRPLLALLIVGGVLLGVTGLSNRPISSTDSARYNIDPYRFAPAAGSLTELRPAWLFHLRQTGERCPKFTGPAEKPGDISSLCTAINRPLVPTIYPPVAEGLFTLVRLPVGSEVRYLPTQLLGLAAMLGTGTLLLLELRRRGRNLAWAGLWLWSPFVVTEAVNASHIDAAATFFALAATVLVARGKRIWGGIAMGLAIATKFVPVLIAPPLVRRKPWAVVISAVATVVLVYLPHLLVAGDAVLGYLPGYLSEEGYDNGSRSALVALVLPGSLATAGAAVALLIVILVSMYRADPASPWVAQVAILGAMLLLTSPRYGWYGLILIPFMLMAKRLEWLPLIAVLAANQYSEDVRHVLPQLLLGQLLLVIIVSILRARRERHLESERLWRIES
jgi:alpha-1,2-mannosyltransferase